MAVTKILAERHTRNLRVAAYIRVSTTEKKQDESYEAQAEYFENKIKNTEGWDFAGIYGERESGTHAENRDDFNRMIKDAEDGKIDLILVKSVSRWSRNIVDGLRTIYHLTENRINIIFEQEGIDTRQPGHTLQLNLATAVAQTESESLSENLKWLYKKRAEKGYIKANKGMYFGYNTDDGKFTPDENAVYVRRIYKEFVEGKPIAGIVRGLEGVKNSRGKAITPAMIRNILKNEVYKGDVHICKSISRNVITGEPDKEQYSKYVKGHHEAIVSEALWDLAQKRFKENSEKFSREEARAREEDVLAMIEDGLSRAEIAEYLGINIEKVKYTVQKLVKEGRLKEGPKGRQRSRQVEERMEKVYTAVKDGHENDVADYLGMKYTEAHYALKKLEQGGRVKKEKGEWVAA